MAAADAVRTGDRPEGAVIGTAIGAIGCELAAAAAFNRLENVRISGVAVFPLAAPGTVSVWLALPPPPPLFTGTRRERAVGLATAIGVASSIE